jgi:hypothetical protein
MQIVLPDNEIRRLGRKIQQDYSAAVSDHARRIERFRRYYQRWRNRVDPPVAGEEDTSNFSVPLMQWNVGHKLADAMGKLLGDDAEIVAKPTGPADQSLAAKIGLYESWRVFQSMRLTNPLTVMSFRQILNGRAHAYSPWVRDTYPVRDPQTGRVLEAVSYEGPGFFPLWPDQFIVPAEDVQSVHDFSFTIRVYRTTPDRMLRGEEQGLYQGVSDRFDKLVAHGRDNQRRASEGEEIQREKDEVEGINFDSSLSAGPGVLVHEWCGWWRKLRRGKDAREENLRERERFESELIIRYLPELNWIVGVQDLLDLYPTKHQRRPIVEASLIKDGSYWNAGFGELLESIEDEVTVNHRLFTDAGRLSVWPLIFFKPSSGFDPDKFHYEAGMALPTEDPNGVRAIQVQGNLQYPIVNQQALVGYGERATGVTDFSQGRASDQPNAPRTARGTLALLEQGNVRANLDTLVLREDMGQIVKHFWELEQQFPSSRRTFFRVTEQQAGGLFPTKDGGSYLEPEELGGEYDFELKFATSVWSREANKDREISLYQLDLGNPLIVNNPRALWMATRRVHKALGDDNFADLIPEPADLARPRTPDEEWTLALQGEPIAVHPDDQDELHVRAHIKQITEETGAGEQADADALQAMVAHIREHREQESRKLLRAAVVQQLGFGPQAGVLGMPNAQPGATPTGQPGAAPNPSIPSQPAPVQESPMNGASSAGPEELPPLGV